MSDIKSRMSLSRADPGATQEALLATETIVEVLSGFPGYLVLSCLTNATAIALCHIHDSETAAVEETKAVRREIERCIRVNHRHFQETKRART